MRTVAGAGAGAAAAAAATVVAAAIAVVAVAARGAAGAGAGAGYTVAVVVAVTVAVLLLLLGGRGGPATQFGQQRGTVLLGDAPPPHAHHPSLRPAVRFAYQALLTVAREERLHHRRSVARLGIAACRVAGCPLDSPDVRLAVGCRVVVLLCCRVTAGYAREMDGRYGS